LAPVALKLDRFLTKELTGTRHSLYFAW
jgi:hypothetical protein